MTWILGADILTCLPVAANDRVGENDDWDSKAFSLHSLGNRRRKGEAIKGGGMCGVRISTLARNGRRKNSSQGLTVRVQSASTDFDRLQVRQAKDVRVTDRFGKQWLIQVIDRFGKKWLTLGSKYGKCLVGPASVCSSIWVV